MFKRMALQFALGLAGRLLQAAFRHMKERRKNKAFDEVVRIADGHVKHLAERAMDPTAKLEAVRANTKAALKALKRDVRTRTVNLAIELAFNALDEKLGK